MLKNRTFSGVIEYEKTLRGGHNSPKISLYGRENCDYTDNRLTVFSFLPLLDWIKSSRLADSNTIQLLVK
jgi:hypothetical protein